MVQPLAGQKPHQGPADIGGKSTNYGRQNQLLQGDQQGSAQGQQQNRGQAVNRKPPHVTGFRDFLLHFSALVSWTLVALSRCPMIKASSFKILLPTPGSVSISLLRSVRKKA